MRVSNVTLRRRLFFALVFAMIIFGAMVVRLAYVQLWMGPTLSQQAEDSWQRNIPFMPKRGEILDRSGEPLTYNVSTPTVMAIPVQIKNPQQTAAKLANLLQASEDKVYKLITKKQSIVRIQPGGRKITTDLANQIRNAHLPGIVIAEDSKRYYPFGELAAHVLGFTGIDNQGLTGVELNYDSELSGIRGNVSYLSDAAGRKMPGSSEQYTKPKDGLNLQLTIDQYLQTVVERELDQAMVKYQAKGAIGIMADPNTGEILAMASRPTYDPAHFSDYPSSVYNHNLPIWMTYEPGSTFKIITLAAALQEHKVDLNKDTYFDDGSIKVSGANLHCWKRGGHGSETFLQVVQNSCNPGFVVLGQRLGKDALFKYINKFGFGKKTGIDLKGEENGILFKPSQVGPVELATTAFGQGVSVTPIQQVAAVSAAINGGKLYKPHLAKAFYNQDTGQLVKEIKPDLERQVISPEISKEVRMALESVVAKGTGRNAFIDGYRVGGKTGTAQKVVNGHYSSSEHIVSFLGFAPADHPKVVLYIAVDNPKGLQFGGLIAAPIVRNIMQDTMQYLNVPKREDQLEKEYRIGEKKLVEVPNLVGMSDQEIMNTLNPNFQIAKSGVGHVVISQVPKAGTKAERGSTIRVYVTDSQS